MKHLDRKAPHLAKSETIKRMPLVCSNELAAVEFLEQTRWGDAPCCVHCGDTDVIQLKGKATGERNKRFLWKCHGCKKQFTVRIGTVYEESRIPLRHWCLAFWLMSVSKKGISALQVMRLTGISYKSALFLVHRIRFAMTPNHAEVPKLTGIVEADETFIGGRRRNRVPTTPENKGKYTRTKHKAAVFAALQRGGNVRVRAIADVSSATLKTAINDLVDKSSRLITDEWSGYSKTGPEYAQHDTIKHSSYQYANGDITTNTVEGFFSILKRGITGVYHSVSREHLHRYLGEFEFRYNARHMNDGQRTLLAIQSADGKRLMYREQSSEAA